MTGHLSPVRWPEAHIEGTILIAVGARYGWLVVTADGTLAPHDLTAPARTSNSTPRFRIVRSSPTLTLEGPIPARSGAGTVSPSDVGRTVRAGPPRPGDRGPRRAGSAARCRYWQDR